MRTLFNRSIIYLTISILIYSCSASESGKSTGSGFQDLFDGNTLDGWVGDPDYWKIENGMIVGEVTPETLLDQNTFLIWQDGEVADFELRVEYRISESGNSGINYRSDEVAGDPNEFIGGVPYALRGYQGDIDGKNLYTGMNYEERKRTTIARRGESVILPKLDKKFSLDENIEANQWMPRIKNKNLGNPDSLAANIFNPDWHEYHIIAIGNHLQHYVDGVLMSEVIDDDVDNRKLEGLIGVQVHVGPPMKVEFKSIRLKRL